MHSIIFGNCLWLLLFVFFNPDCNVFSDDAHPVNEATTLRVEKKVTRKEEAMTEKWQGLSKLEAKSVDSSSLQCIQLQNNELLALHSDGDVVIGGFFPLHFAAYMPQHSYNSKPQITSCSG